MFVALSVDWMIGVFDEEKLAKRGLTLNYWMSEFDVSGILFENI